MPQPALQGIGPAGKSGASKPAQSAPIESQIITFANLSVHMVHTKPLCTRIATFTLCIPHPANADLRWKLFSQFSYRNVRDVMKRREPFTFNRNINQLWQ